MYIIYGGKSINIYIYIRLCSCCCQGSLETVPASGVPRLKWLQKNQNEAASILGHGPNMALQFSGSAWTCSSTSIFDAHLHKVFGLAVNLGCLLGRSHHCQTHLNHRIQGPLLGQASCQSLGGCPTSNKKRIRLICSYNSGGQHGESFLLFQCNPGLTCFFRSDPICIGPLDTSKILMCASVCDMDPIYNLAPSSWHELLPLAPAPLDTQKSWINPSHQPQKPGIKLQTPTVDHCMFGV